MKSSRSKVVENPADEWGVGKPFDRSTGGALYILSVAVSSVLLRRDRERIWPRSFITLVTPLMLVPQDPGSQDYCLSSAGLRVCRDASSRGSGSWHAWWTLLPGLSR